MPHKEGHDPQPAPPLSPSDFNHDRLKQWLATQTISVQKLISGEIQAVDIVLGSGGTIESSNFVTGSAGWQIDGDGNAEFNDVTVRGDVVSSNWDGADPVDLSSEDTGASVGFALDSSEGAAQFEGSVWIGGNLTILDSEGKVFVGPDDDRIILTSETNRYRVIDSTSDFYVDAVVEFDVNYSHASITTPAAISAYVDTGGAPGDSDFLFVAGPHDGTQLSDAARVSLGFNGSDKTEAFLYADETVVGGADFVNIEDTSNNLIAKFTTSQITLGMGGSAGTPALSFANDPDTGLFLSGAGVGITAGGSTNLIVRDNAMFAPAVGDATTSSGGNVFIEGSGSHQMKRSTSSLKYKPDWRPAPEAADYELPLPIKWTDEKGQLRLGFGAEQVWGAVPEAYEDEIYDLRSLVAILSEKVKRLEGRSITRRLSALFQRAG